MVFYVFYVDFGGINFGFVCFVVNVFVVVVVYVMLYGCFVK